MYFGYKIEGLDEKLYLQLVADDSMSWVSSPEELQAVISLFEYYGKAYAMEFCFPKTLINVYGKKEDVEKIRTSSNIKIAGNEPNFPEEAVHLGLTQCQDNSRTEVVNATRCKNKAMGKLLNMFGDRFSSGIPLRMSLNKVIWNTYIKPTLLTGLNALVIKDDSMKILQQFQETVIRRMFKVRDKASITPLLDISGIEPVEASLHKQVFSLFYNFWLNPETPSSKLNKLILQNPEKYKKMNYWPNHVRDLCDKYNLPSPLKLLSEKIPSKEAWKSYIEKKINSYHQNKMKDKIEEMSTTAFLIDKKRYRYSKKGRQFINAPETLNDVRSAGIKSLFLADEYPTRCHDNRIRGRRGEDDSCKHCLKNGRAESDTTTHAIEFCSLVQNEDDLHHVWSKILEQSAAILDTCPTFLSTYFKLNPGAKTTFILNPNHRALPDGIVIGQHLLSNSLLNLLSRYVWLVHIIRVKANIATRDLERSNSNGKNDPEPGDLSPKDKASKGKQKRPQANNILNYFAKTNNQVVSDHGEVKKMIDTWTRLGYPHNSEHPHQLLAVIVCPGVSSVQGTVMWEDSPGRSVMGRTTSFRMLPAPEMKDEMKAFNGCLEILSQDENLINNLHVTTSDAFTSADLREIITAAPDVINGSGHPALRSWTDVIVPCSIVSTIVKGSAPLRIRSVSTRRNTPQLYVTHYDGVVSEDFGSTTDYNLVAESRYLGKCPFLENVMDWRGVNHADHTATILVLGRCGDDEEVERMISILRSLADQAAHKDVLNKITHHQGRMMLNQAVNYWQYSIDFSRIHLADSMFAFLSYHLERLRLHTRDPSVFAPHGQVEDNVSEILRITKDIQKKMIANNLKPADATH